MNPIEPMVARFQCVGCVCECAAGCDSYKLGTGNGALWCENHAPGTLQFPGDRFFLGLPKGFCKTGPREKRYIGGIRLWSKGKGQPFWDKFNMPVWAMLQDGYLFVRTYMPRLNIGVTDVIEGATELPEGAIDVAEFQGKID